MCSPEPTIDDLLALAEEAVETTLADLHRTSSVRPKVVVEPLGNHTLRISVDGNYSDPSMHATTRAAALAEVAGIFQDQLDHECWPVCGKHEVGLHAEVYEGVAVWRCRLGGHFVARIGELAPDN